MNIDLLFDIFINNEMNYKILSSALLILMFWCVYLLNNFVFYSIQARFPSHLSSAFKLFRVFVRIVIIVIGFISLLESWGIDIRTLIAGFGITGFIVTYALKDVLSSSLSGLLILVYRPFKKGDRIKVLGLEGVVKKIEMQYTTILFGNKEYKVPNTKVSSEAVIIQDLDSGSAK